MGGKPSHSDFEELPNPTKSYTPKSNGKHEEIESQLAAMLIRITTITLWEIIPVVGKVATIVNYSTKFFDYIDCLTSTIDLLNAKESMDPMIQLMKETIKKESVRTAFASLNAKMATIKSRLQEIVDSNLTTTNKLSKASIAANTCEEILHLFDNDDYILWETGTISSALLLPFSAICAQVIKYSYENRCTSEHQSKKMKGQLISVLEDYKKQCILDRLNFVTIETRDFCVHSGGMPVSEYGLGHSKFSNDIDTVLSREWHRTYFCKDTWDDCKQRRTTYESIIDYRKKMIAYYETDFHNAIRMVRDQLVAINTTNEYTKKQKKFCEKHVQSSVVALP